MAYSAQKNYSTPPREDIEDISVSSCFDSSRGNRSSLQGSFWLRGTVGLICLVYTILFVLSLSDFWFSPEWTTDDALQQTYPFHEVYEPGIFENDIVTAMMKGYLTPLHYWITYAFTVLTQDAILAGHWVQLIQIVATCAFLGAALYRSGGFIPACFGFMWFLHTRHIIQRLTAGLVRGWAAPLMAAYFYFAMSKNHLGMRLCLLVGCILHPPATFLIAFAYGGLLVWEFIDSRTRAEVTRPLLYLILISPLCAFLALYSTAMPEDLGTMASYNETLTRPEFARPGGRFPFTPLVPLVEEVKTFAFQAFLNKWHNIGRSGDNAVIALALAIVGGILVVGVRNRRWYIPRSICAFLVASIITYLLSRFFAFHLYVPNRHLQFPIAFFFIMACTLGLWRLGHEFPSRALRGERGGVLLLGALAALIFIGSGDGLQSQANFNWHVEQRGRVWQWLRENTERDALIAGHPTFVDPVQLLAHRKVYISTETAHPFYDKYYRAIEPRLALSLQAHYAPDLKTLYELVAPEGIGYFILERARFYPEALAEASFFRPLDQLVHAATRRPWQDYAYRQLPSKLDPERAPFLVYRDAFCVVLDIHKLGEFVKGTP
jgi:hypothetical protein